MSSDVSDVREELLSRMTANKLVRDVNDHTYISLRRRYMFHTVGKAANSSVKEIMYKLELAGTHYKSPSVHARQMSPLLSPYQLDDRGFESVFLSDGFFRFTFVRNPYSRLLSCYLDRIADQKSRPYLELVRYMGRERGYSPTFPEFIEAICDQSPKQQNNHWRIQYYDAMCDVITYSFVGKQERFSEDISYIYKCVSGDPIPVDASKVNASPASTGASRRIQSFWSVDLVRKVAAHYASDFDFFRYPVKLDKA